MAIQTTSLQTSAVGTRYALAYQRGAKQYRYYDQFAGNVMTDTQYNIEGRKGLGTTYTFAFQSRMTPGTTAISETIDIVPQIIRDATSTITPVSRGEAIKWTQLLSVESFMDEQAMRAEIVGINAMESIENLALAAGLQGNLISRATTRILLSGATAAHLFTEAAVATAGALLADAKAPMYVDENGGQGWMALVHNDANYDLIHGGNLVNVALYQDKNILLMNGEVGRIGDFRIIATPHSKVFYGAGAVNGSSAATTLSGASKALDLTIILASGTNSSAGRHLCLGTLETANTFTDSNEAVRYVSGTTTVTLVGSGTNGGLRFDHASGDTINNNMNVYPVLYGSPNSLAKVYASDVGEFGQLVGPLYDGLAQQWQSLAWKFFGGYGRVAENRLARGEYATSLDNI